MRYSYKISNIFFIYNNKSRLDNVFMIFCYFIAINY